MGPACRPYASPSPSETNKRDHRNDRNDRNEWNEWNHRTGDGGKCAGTTGPNPPVGNLAALG